MKVMSFSEEYRQSFIDFNTDWIIDYFGYLEKEDYDTFQQIDSELAQGAMIFIAVDDNDNPLACCMVRPMSNKRWEICKFASNKHINHKGAGSAVFEASINYAIKKHAQELFLLSNTKLKAALHIYKKYGFKEIKLKDYEYNRGNIAFKKVLS